MLILLLRVDNWLTNSFSFFKAILFLIFYYLQFGFVFQTKMRRITRPDLTINFSSYRHFHRFHLVKTTGKWLIMGKQKPRGLFYWIWAEWRKPLTISIGNSLSTLYKALNCLYTMQWHLYCNNFKRAIFFTTFAISGNSVVYIRCSLFISAFKKSLSLIRGRFLYLKSFVWRKAFQFWG